MHDMYVIIGSIVKENNNIYDTAFVFSPGKKKMFYHKRALWGWYQENFCRGNFIRSILIYDLEKKQPDFGELGRIQISDWLTSRDIQ